MKSAYENFPAGKTAEQWKAELSPEYFPIWANGLRGGTQAPFTGEFDNFFPKAGHFACNACSHPLYAAKDKFDHPCGWCSFEGNLPSAVGVGADTEDEKRFGSRRPRDEIWCNNCGGHLGHRFSDHSPWRDCVNSICVKYVDAEPTAKPAEKK